MQKEYLMAETNVQKHQRVTREISDFILKNFPDINDKPGPLNDAMAALETGCQLAIPGLRVTIKYGPVCE